MKKLFVVSDVHGFYYELTDALHKAGYDITDTNHIFVSCGDLLDRGAFPLNCLRFVNSIPEKQKILITGNHEDLIEKAIARRDFLSHDWSNGTTQTALDLAGEGIVAIEDVFDRLRKHEEYNKYISSTIDYFETDKYIFTHAWIPCDRSDENPYHTRDVHYTYNSNWRDSSHSKWKGARWPNGMECWKQGVREPNKTIVVGHWHSSWGHHYLHKDSEEFPNPRSTNPEHQKANFSPFIDDGIIAIDACTAFSRQVNVQILEIEDEDFERAYSKFYEQTE